MSDLKNRIQSDIKSAMLKRDTFTVATLRLVLGDLQNAEKSGKNAKEFSDAQVEEFLAKAVKTRRGSAEIFAEKGHPERAEKETDEADLLATYLPQPMDDADVVELVRAAISGLDAPKIGDVMKSVKASISESGKSVDGRRLSEIVRSELS